jgi:hypothetical protein
LAGAGQNDCIGVCLWPVRRSGPRALAPWCAASACRVTWTLRWARGTSRAPAHQAGPLEFFSTSSRPASGRPPAALGRHNARVRRRRPHPPPRGTWSSHEVSAPARPGRYLAITPQCFGQPRIATANMCLTAASSTELARPAPPVESPCTRSHLASIRIDWSHRPGTRISDNQLFQIQSINTSPAPARRVRMKGTGELNGLDGDIPYGRTNRQLTEQSFKKEVLRVAPIDNDYLRESFRSAALASSSDASGGS